MYFISLHENVILFLWSLSTYGPNFSVEGDTPVPQGGELQLLMLGLNLALLFKIPSAYLLNLYFVQVTRKKSVHSATLSF